MFLTLKILKLRIYMLMQLLISPAEIGTTGSFSEAATPARVLLFSETRLTKKNMRKMNILCCLE